MSLPSEDFVPHLGSPLREILWKRGFRDNEEVSRFLRPKLSDIPSPIGQMKDLDEALSLLLKARDQKFPVVIFGDYDVDGTTSTVLLLTAFREWGFEVDYFIPHRVNEGYGVTLKAAQKLLTEKPNTKLVVTCDSGVSSFDGIDFLRSQNVLVIVTDHHEVPPTRVAANAILNPKQKDCPYPDKKLAGVGVAFLLLIALRRALNLKDFPLSPWLDLVAIGTVCDVAELSGVNRIFVKLGLEWLQKTERVGLQVILRELGLQSRTIKAKDLGFMIGPRLNATGRIGDPSLGVKTLLSNSDTEAMSLVAILESQNRLRREMQEVQLKEALALAARLLSKNPTLKTLVIADSGFHLGIVGLLAARLAEMYQRPTCVLTELQDEHALADFQERSGIWKGSLRTPSGYHLADALQNIRESTPDLLLSGGGHALAAGVAISSAHLKIFESEFERAIDKQIKIHLPVFADAELSGSQALLDLLNLLEPFGNGNPPPLFLIRDFELKRVQVMKEVHLKHFGVFQGSDWSVLHFKSQWVRLFSQLERPTQVRFDFLAELSENEWQGSKRIELVLKDLLEMRVGGKKHRIEKQNEISASEGFREAR